MDRTHDSSANPRSTLSIAGHPLHPMIVPLPIASFIGALAADIAYATIFPGMTIVKILFVDIVPAFFRSG